MEQEIILTIPVVWRGKKLIVEINSGASLKEFGDELQRLTEIRADTLKLIVPQSSGKSSTLLSPFSAEHSHLKLQDTSIPEVKSIRMMGVSEGEFNQVLRSANADMRIIGFEEEVKRMQRMSYVPRTSYKLPEGPYIFCDFRTLEIPGIQLNPPPSEALKRMHRLAADPGIVAIMNKHRWRVGIMTELAPVGYVGVSPKCILGFNKNNGEEISLRLRTDDLKGFRKYESIKKTLLHELAHMVYSEHDANFHALDKQLNQEAASLDWTKSRSHTLTGVSSSEHYDVDSEFESQSNISYKLGGDKSNVSASARAASVTAAYHRLADTLASRSVEEKEPDPDDRELDIHGKASSVGTEDKIESISEVEMRDDHEPDNDVCTPVQTEVEPDPDDSLSGESMESEPYSDFEAVTKVEKASNDFEMQDTVKVVTINERLGSDLWSEEPDPDDAAESRQNYAAESSYVDPHSTKVEENMETVIDARNDPKLHDLAANTSCLQVYDRFGTANGVGYQNKSEAELKVESCGSFKEPDPDDQWAHPDMTPAVKTDEPDPDDKELQRIQDPVTVFCNRLTKTIEMLLSEVGSTGGAPVLQTLVKIIRNLLEHPNEVKYRRLRKGNPTFQRSVSNYKAALEILHLVGFHEDTVLDEIGWAETYLVLKRDDPGLLWLAKSSLETKVAQ